jgi:acetyl esterase
VAILARDKKVHAPVDQLLVYPITDDNMDTPSYKLYAEAKPLNKSAMKWFLAHTLGGQSTQQVRSAFPLKADLTGLPTATIITAELDPLRDDGKRYADKLEKANINVAYRNFDGVTHEFFGMGAVLPDAKKAVEFAADGLKTAFKK